MTTQDILIGSHATHVRELQTANAKLREENARLRDEATALRAHFDLALLAAEDLKDCERLEIWDGWNLLLGAKKEARDRADLLAQAEARAGNGVRVWIVFDGKDENVSTKAGVRVSYTGGSGLHRADKFICDYLRMAKYLGLAGKVSVRTNDKDFAKTVARLQR